MRLPTKFAVALSALLFAGTLFTAYGKAPNVIIIMADELGHGDVGFNGGNTFPTPNLNRIAAGGAVCTNGYASHIVSSAARAGLITGRYPSRFGYERTVAWRPKLGDVGLPVTEKTLADALRPLGYKSGFIGKWHLGANDNFHPLNRGFDDFFGFLGGGHLNYPEEYTVKNTLDARNEPESYKTWILRGFEPVKTQRHLTDEFSQEALDFVRRQGDNPFFLFLSHHAPRGPLQVPEGELAALSHIKDEKRRKYAALITMMDRGVGQLLDLLDSLNIADNTLLFFVSSVGGDSDVTGAYNGWVRGKRGEPFEGGIRVPFVVRWPDKIPGGITFKQPVSTLDIFATVAAATKLVEDPKHPLDGFDLVPFLRGDQNGAPHELLFQRLYDLGMFVVREGDYKLIKNKKESVPSLYNLATDPLEKTNIADTNPEIVKKLTDAFYTWNAQMIAPTVMGIDMKEWSQGL